MADQLDDAKSQLDVKSAEITALSAQLKEREEEMNAKEAHLKEMKNMNAALENQLTEYMDALDHQNQVRTPPRGGKGVNACERVGLNGVLVILGELPNVTAMHASLSLSL